MPKILSTLVCWVNIFLFNNTWTCKSRDSYDPHWAYIREKITCFYRILAHSVHRNLTHWVFLWKVYSILLEIRSTYLENILPYKHTTSCEKSPWMLLPTICTFEMLIVISWFICSISSKKKYLNFFFMARNNRNLIDPSQFIFSWYLFFFAGKPPIHHQSGLGQLWGHWAVPRPRQLMR